MTSDNFPYDIDVDIYNSGLDSDFWNKLNKNTSNSSPKPAYEDLREYQKISEDIDRKAIDLTRQMEKDISKF